jgi:Arc/MetJ-type ribon-helix-helix transcriptional regulator
MTAKISISVPDDVAAFLQSQGNASAAVTEAVRRIMPEARRTRQRQAAQAFGEYQRRQTPQEAAESRALIETSNDIALRDAQW